VALVTAALYPDRVSKVSTNGTPCSGAGFEDLAAFADAGDLPPTDQEFTEMFASVIRTWTTPESRFPDLVAPGASGMARFVEWLVRFERNAASPGDLAAHLRSLEGFDLRPYLDRVGCPVLLTHATHDRFVPLWRSVRHRWHRPGSRRHRTVRR